MGGNLSTEKWVQWEPDENIAKCSKCGVEFFKYAGLFPRKHHCRNCGKIFCSDCSSVKSAINNKVVRVCLNCSRELKSAASSRTQSEIEIKPESIKEFIKEEPIFQLEAIQSRTITGEEIKLTLHSSFQPFKVLVKNSTETIDEISSNSEPQEKHSNHIKLKMETNRKWTIFFTCTVPGQYELEIIKEVEPQTISIDLEIVPGPPDLSKSVLSLIDQISDSKKIPYCVVEQFPAILEFKTLIIDKYGNPTTADLIPVYIENTFETEDLLKEPPKGVPMEVRKGKGGEFIFRSSFPRNSTYFVRLFINNQEIPSGPLSITCLTKEQAEMYMSFLEKGEAKFTGELLSINGNQPVEIVLVKKKHLKIKKKNVFKSKIVKFPADEQINIIILSPTTIQLFKNKVYYVKLTSMGLFEITLEKFFENGSCVLNSNFSDRFNWFSNQLYELCPCFHSSTIHMVISRERLVLDLVQFFKNQSPSVIRDSKLIVSFKGEEGMDYGGISKEFFYTISRAMTARIFSKDYVLFSSPGENGYYTPDPFSSKIENYEEIFWALGILCAKSICETTLKEARYLAIQFTSSFFKGILDIPIETDDLSEIDPIFFKNFIQRLKETEDPSDFAKEVFEGEHLIFRDDVSDSKGNLRSNKKKVLGIINKRVTSSNKNDYLNFVATNRLYSVIKVQLEEFKKGFYSIIPHEIISVFTPKEFEKLLSGERNIDVEDLIKNMDFPNIPRVIIFEEKHITMFTKVLREMNSKELSMFIQFLTGSPMAPSGGFGQLVPKITVHFLPPSERLPTASTCSNFLECPKYSSFEVMKNSVFKAIEHCEGFGMM